MSLIRVWRLRPFQNLLQRLLMTTIATNADLVAGLLAVTAEVNKASSDLTAALAKIAQLEAELATAGQITPEVQSAFDGLQAAATAASALVPVPAPVVVDPAAPVDPAVPVPRN
jgi:hypothetical protein